MRWLPLFVVLCLCVLPAVAKHSKANFVSSDDFVYLSKFCYSNKEPGTLNFTISSKTNHTYFALYNDGGSTNWNNVWNSKMNCSEKLRHAVVSLLATPNATFHSLRPNQIPRPRWWYVAAVNCEAEKYDFKGDFLFLNPGSTWNRQFSFDEDGLLTLYLILFIFFCIGITAHLYGAYLLFQVRSLHPLVLLLSGSIALELLTFFCYLIHFGSYGDNGVGAPVMEDFGELFDMFQVVLFTFLLVMMSRGWGISGLPITNANFLLVGSGAYLVLFFILYLCQQVAIDPVDTIFYYDTTPGYMIAILRLFVMAYFGYNTYVSFIAENHPSKRRFYLALGVLGSIWFLSLPIIVFIASAISSWVREKTVMTVYYIFNSAALGIMAYLVWPTNAAQYFKIAPAEYQSTFTPATPGSSSVAYETF